MEATCLLDIVGEYDTPICDTYDMQRGPTPPASPASRCSRRTYILCPDCHVAILRRCSKSQYSDSHEASSAVESGHGIILEGFKIVDRVMRAKLCSRSDAHSLFSARNQHFFQHSFKPRSSILRE